MRSLAHLEFVLGHRRENGGIFETLPIALGDLRVAYPVESHLVEDPRACQTYCDALKIVRASERKHILVKGVDSRDVVDR